MQWSSHLPAANVQILKVLKWSSCLMYFDDTNVVGTSFADHLSNIGGILARLWGEGLKLKPEEKYHLCQESVACFSWAHCLIAGNYHRPEQNGCSCKMAYSTVKTRSAAIPRKRKLLQKICDELCVHCKVTAATH